MFLYKVAKRDSFLMQSRISDLWDIQPFLHVLYLPLMACISVYWESVNHEIVKENKRSAIFLSLFETKPSYLSLVLTSVYVFFVFLSVCNEQIALLKSLLVIIEWDDCQDWLYVLDGNEKEKSDIDVFSFFASWLLKKKNICTKNNFCNEVEENLGVLFFYTRFVVKYWIEKNKRTSDC